MSLEVDRRITPLVKTQNPMLPALLVLLFGLGCTVDSSATEPDIRWRAGGHFLSVASVDFLPDGQHLISASSEVDVKLWHLPTRRMAWASSDGHFGASGISVAPDGSFFFAAATEMDTNLVVRALSEGFQTTRVGSLHVIPYAKAISPSGQRAAAGGFSATPIEVRDLRVWNIASGLELAALLAESLPEIGYIERLEFVTEDDLIIGSFNRLTRWSMDGTVRWSRSAPPPGEVLLKSISPDRNRLLVEEDRALKLLDSATGEPMWTLAGAAVDSWRARFNPEGTRFALAFSDNPPGQGRIEIRATADGALLRTLPIPFLLPVPSFSPDSLWLACGHTEGIHLTPLAGEAAWEPLTDSWGPIRRVAIGAAQDWIASSRGRRLDLRRLDTGVHFRSLEMGSPMAIAAAPDGSWLAFNTNSTHLARYRPATDSYDAPAIETGTLSDLSVSADGRRLLAVPLNGEAWMLDAATWQVTARPKGAGPVLAAWARDASRLSVGFGGLARTYDLDASQARFTRDWGTDLIRFLEYLPDGETVLSLHRSGQLRRWRVTDGEVLSEAATGLTKPTSVTLSPDQRVLLVAVRGEGIRILDAATGAELDRWTRDTGYQVSSLRFSEDGAWLVNGRLDGTVVFSRAPIVLHSARAAGLGLEFFISGGSGPYQLQRYSARNGSWSNIGLQFTGNSASVDFDGPGPWLYRLVTAP